MATDGVGNLLSGLFGTLPTTTYSTSVGVAEITGVAARRVGVFVGASFLVLAFFPKVVALLLAIPNAVAASFTLALAAVLFTLGIKLVVASGLDFRKSAIVGISFWAGVGFQNGWVFPELLTGRWALMLGNGMTAGGIMAVILEPPGQWKRLTLDLDAAAIRSVDEFVVGLAAKRRWSEAAMACIVKSVDERRPSAYGRRISEPRMAVFWLTGMPCSGKTTIGRALVERLGDLGRVACLIDGDVVRRGDLSRRLGFSAADRRENVRRVVGLAAPLARNVDVVVAMVSPTEQIREPARALPGLVMVGLHCPPDVARQRDFKGVYRRAWDAAAYEPPDPAAVIIDTSRSGVTECVERILRAAGARGGEA